MARMTQVLDVEGAAAAEPIIPPPAPLRRPRSPPPAPREPSQRDEENNSDRNSKKFAPPGHQSMQKAGGSTPRGGGARNFNNRQNDNSFDKSDRPQSDRPFNNRQPNRQFDKTERQFDKNERQFDKKERHFDKPDCQGLAGRPSTRRPQAADDENWGFRGDSNRRQNGPRSEPFLDRRRQHNQPNNWSQSRDDDDDEDWDAPKPESKAPPKADSPSVKLPPKEASPAPVVQKPVASPANQSSASEANQKEVKAPMSSVKPMGSLADVTPSKKLIPNKCVMDTLSVGDSVLLSVDNSAQACLAPGPGFVCLSLHERYEAEYQALCDQLPQAASGQPAYQPEIGETFCWLNPEDESWYRARRVSTTQCALLDSSRVVDMASGNTARLPPDYHSQPEMCCLLAHAGNTVQIGNNLKCDLVEKSAKGWKVKMQNVEDGAELGMGELTRWLPTIDYPKTVATPAAQTNPVAAPKSVPATAPVMAPKSVPAVTPLAATKTVPTTATSNAPATASASVDIPEVPRPDVTNKSMVLLVEVTDMSNVFVRPADPDKQRAYDSILFETVLFGRSAKPLTEPPVKGQYVVSKFTDDNHYRALVKRTSVKLNKYLLEYTEFGNTHVNTLENLYPCPANLQLERSPVVTSRVALATRHGARALATPAIEYLDKLKDDCVPLVLTISTGAATGGSGCEVSLTVEADKQSVNDKVEALSTPDWVALERRGGDVLETERMMYNSLEFVELEGSACDVTVLDFSALPGGTLSACPRNHPLVERVTTTLTQQMNEYCESELGREPYLPKVEELCIAKLPPYPQWFRAVVAEQVGGPGGSEVEVCYIDYGNLERVSVSLLRKMLPEFVRDIPALGTTLQIRDFPSNATSSMLQRAIDHMEMNNEGQGTLRVTNVVKEAPGTYTVDAPDLIKAMLQS